MSKKKIDKELKSPDQFVSFWSRTAAWAGPRRKPMLIGLAGLLVAGALVWIGQAFMAGRSERASRAFVRIPQVATAPLLPESGEAPKFEDGLPHFKTDRERLEGAVKEADAFLGAYGGKLREEALLLKARYLLTLGRGDEAVAIYTELGGSLDERLRFLALEGLAYAHEATGQIDKAIATFGALADKSKTAGNFMRDRALFNKARLLERKGNTQEAQKLYREVLSEVPLSPLKEQINDRLAVLEGK